MIQEQIKPVNYVEYPGYFFVSEEQNIPEKDGYIPVDRGLSLDDLKRVMFEDSKWMDKQDKENFKKVIEYLDNTSLFGE